MARRLRYEAPRLVRLGSVADLTKSGGTVVGPDAIIGTTSANPVNILRG